MRGSTQLHVGRSLRDPWILFAFVCLVISLGLIVIPQLSIFLSSVKGEDGQFSLELVNCLGSCALAPVMVIDETYYGKVTLEKLPGILAQYQEVRSS